MAGGVEALRRILLASGRARRNAVGKRRQRGVRLRNKRPTRVSSSVERREPVGIRVLRVTGRGRTIRLRRALECLRGLIIVVRHTRGRSRGLNSLRHVPLAHINVRGPVHGNVRPTAVIKSCVWNGWQRLRLVVQTRMHAVLTVRVRGLVRRRSLQSCVVTTVH